MVFHGEDDGDIVFLRFDPKTSKIPPKVHRART